MSDKLWGGRFSKSTDAAANHFHSSLSFDKRLYKQDIKGSMAHCEMLVKQNIIPKTDGEQIMHGLNDILCGIESGEIRFDEKAEDIHMNIETLLTKRIGEAGKKLHTGRSRNDQVALDMRMYAIEETDNIISEIILLIRALNDTAKQHTATVMPGYTHLQRAQPITFAHHLLAYCEMFKRDCGRLRDCAKRTDVMPLGAGALAASTFPLDREFIREKLGFSEITVNSLDAVSDRDFLLELLSALSIFMMHLSRFCEEIIMWASYEFKFIEIDDAYATGSSIMPQKKNPDMAELIRGKTGRVYGGLVTLLTVMKGLPLAYNKDMQEDKEAAFDAIDTVKMCLPVFTGMIKTVSVRKNSMENAAKGGFINATDAADYLVKKGAAFRDAHEISGKMVLYCIDNSKNLDDLSPEELQKFSPLFDDKFYEAVSLKTCVDARAVFGGPSEQSVKKMIEINEKWLDR